MYNSFRHCLCSIHEVVSIVLTLSKTCDKISLRLSDKAPQVNQIRLATLIT